MTSERRKNILLVSFDDSLSFHRYRTVFGEPLRIPNLDRFAKKATNFNAAYCQAPVCGPSRASFMTARSTHDIDVLENATELFDKVRPEDVWSYRLKQAGYHCSSGGKVHHRYRPLAPEHHAVLYHDEPKTFRSDMTFPPVGEKKKRYGGNRGGWSSTDPKDDKLYHDQQSADSAIAFLNDYDGEAPFYREVGFYSPHGPHHTPSRYKEIYNVGNFCPPEAWADGFDDHPWSEENSPQNPHLNSGNLEWWRSSVRNYFSALSHGDHHFGRVWDALQASAHAENTVVILLSDHGFHLGNRNRYRKTTLWEQSAGVPLMIYDPDRPGGDEVDDPVALLDVGPTVLDFADLPPIEGVLGRSLKPYLDGEGDPDRPVATLYRASTSIRKGDYRIIYYEDGSTQLFDLKSDYWQQNDLGRDHPVFAEMYAALAATSAAHGLEIPPEPGPKLNEPPKRLPGLTYSAPPKPGSRPGDKKPLGIVTMLYKDYFYLDRWYRYYAEQVGPENLFVFSHGGDPEHHRIAPKANIITLPRDEAMIKFDRRRWRMMSQFTSGMLEFYDWMVVADVDEILLVDPDVSPSLIDHIQDYYSGPGGPRNIAPFALDLIHAPEDEPLALEPSETILSRRRTYRPSRVYSKPCLIGAPTIFGPGGHRNSMGQRHLADHLYLLHMKFVDRATMEARAEEKRAALEAAGVHNADYRAGHQWSETLQAHSAVLEGATIHGEDIELRWFREEMRKQSERYTDQFVWGPVETQDLWKIPERFAKLI